jgi:hypothetical protein
VKTITPIFQTLFAIGLVVLMAYCIFTSLKTGFIPGRGPRNIPLKKVNPTLYWLCVVAFVVMFGGSIWMLITAVANDFGFTV